MASQVLLSQQTVIGYQLPLQLCRKITEQLLARKRTKTKGGGRLGMWGGEEGEIRYCFISFSAPIPRILSPQRGVKLQRNSSSKPSQRSCESLFNTCRRHLVQVLSGAHHLTNSHMTNRYFTTVKTKGGKPSNISLFHLLLYRCKTRFICLFPVHLSSLSVLSVF